MKNFTELLKSEIRPALGVTEVGAIALAAARAYDAVGGTIVHIEMNMNGGMYKNGFSCGIPGTEELGCEMAAALGALGGQWQLGLECLKDITDEHVRIAKDIPVQIFLQKEKEDIYILAEVTTTKGVGITRIEDAHDNIVFVAKDDQIIFAKEQKETKERKEVIDFDSITFSDMVEYVSSVSLEEIDFIKDMIAMNCRLSEKGQKGVGLSIGATLDAFQKKGVIGMDMIYHAQKLTCAAMDARLSGLPYPAMSIVGSGSHGIVCSLPVVSYGRSVEAPEEKVVRAVALSCLVTIYSKHYTGRLSALCGCVIGGGSGAAAGVIYLMGGGASEVSHATNHMAANLTGMICDGGSTGCSLKASAGVYSAFLSAMLAMTGTVMPYHFGVIGSSAEQTVRNLGRISDEGMSPMNRTIIDIMQQKK
ncbi:L-cysteine desulfidase family protein [Anaerotignum sp. MB30-C6]|uniref:L-cysteine desulfidase family protein n=1 Tax=Anaerotignum sp. MB30-C6 TaxID=3070814 RepID=UPI0027DBAAFF|nr:L-serine ammonia-lyase, iron-sulfur-dependent, subunit alpha [Anaerotignum sp. MB30-C6]WMI81197.1 L-serine ammonia-lyase, iron-sulfur-dependent, subunit alpha [Anaerotignum sp. MB30-C6]